MAVFRRDHRGFVQWQTDARRRKPANRLIAAGVSIRGEIEIEGPLKSALEGLLELGALARR